MEKTKNVILIVGLIAISLCVSEVIMFGRFPGTYPSDSFAALKEATSSNTPAPEPVTMDALIEIRDEGMKYTDVKSEKAARDLEEELSKLYDRLTDVEFELQKIEMFSPALNAAEGIYGFSKPIDPKELEELGIDTEEIKEIVKLFE